MREAMLALVLAIALLPAVQAHDSATRNESAEYLAGTGDFYLRCSSVANLGGACFNLTGYEHQATVRIDDETFDRTPGFWKVTNGGGYTYDSGEFCDETTFTIPNLHVDFAPRKLFVFVEETDRADCENPGGATRGEIAVAFSGEGPVP